MLTVKIKICQYYAARSRKLQTSASCQPQRACFPLTQLGKVQALRGLGYVAPEDPNQLPQAPPKEHVPLEERLFGTEKQEHFERQLHCHEHSVIALCVALVLISEAFLTVCVPLPRRVCERLCFGVVFSLQK